MPFQLRCPLALVIITGQPVSGDQEEYQYYNESDGESDCAEAADCTVGVPGTGRGYNDRLDEWGLLIGRHRGKQFSLSKGVIIRTFLVSDCRNEPAWEPASSSGEGAEQSKDDRCVASRLSANQVSRSAAGCSRRPMFPDCGEKEMKSSCEDWGEDSG